MESNILVKIQDLYESLSKPRKRIADIILSNGDLVTFMSLQDLGKVTNTSPVTVVKFAKDLGYSSFSEMRKAIQEHIKNIKQSGYFVLPSDELPLDKALEDIFEDTLQSEFFLLSETYRDSKERIINAAKVISEARRVFIVSTGLIDAMTHIMSMRFSYMHIDVEVLNISHMPLIPSKMEHVCSDDVFICLTFPHYSHSIAAMVKCAHIKGCKVIGITDSPSAPIAPLVDILLVCPSKSVLFANSLTGVTSMINMLATMILSQKKGKIDSNKEITNILEEFYPIVSKPLELKDDKFSAINKFESPC